MAKTFYLLRKPSEERVREILEARKEDHFTYNGAGATRSGAIPGLPINHHRLQLGWGEAIYGRAVHALQRWAIYRTGWTQLCWPDIPLEAGQIVVVLARHGPVWSLNPCRIVYLLEERGMVERFGFALGTLPGHAETGEERFTVEWRRQDDSVHYELFACAGPAGFLTTVGYPFLRLVQWRFGKASMRAMIKAVHQGRPRSS